jgi:hypothetical protein
MQQCRLRSRSNSFTNWIRRRTCAYVHGSTNVQYSRASECGACRKNNIQGIHGSTTYYYATPACIGVSIGDACMFLAAKHGDRIVQKTTTTVTTSLRARSCDAPSDGRPHARGAPRHARSRSRRTDDGALLHGRRRFVVTRPYYSCKVASVEGVKPSSSSMHACNHGDAPWASRVFCSLPS